MASGKWRPFRLSLNVLFVFENMKSFSENETAEVVWILPCWIHMWNHFDILATLKARILLSGQCIEQIRMEYSYVGTKRVGIATISLSPPPTPPPPTHPAQCRIYASVN